METVSSVSCFILVTEDDVNETQTRSSIIWIEDIQKGVINPFIYKAN